jgi:hypothetical protein
MDQHRAIFASRTDSSVRRPSNYHRFRGATYEKQWSIGPIEVSDVPLAAKGTLLEGGAGGPGRSAAFGVRPTDARPSARGY